MARTPSGDGAASVVKRNPGPPNFDPQTAIHTLDHSDQVRAPGFGAFSETVVSSTPPVAGIVEPVSTASAAQTSTLSPGEIAASGSFSADGDAFPLDAQQLALVNGLLQPPVPCSPALPASWRGWWSSPRRSRTRSTCRACSRRAPTRCAP